jgi:hypothetical protein
MPSAPRQHSTNSCCRSSQTLSILVLTATPIQLPQPPISILFPLSLLSLAPPGSTPSRPLPPTVLLPAFRPRATARQMRRHLRPRREASRSKSSSGRALKCPGIRSRMRSRVKKMDSRGSRFRLNGPMRTLSRRGLFPSTKSTISLRCEGFTPCDQKGIGIADSTSGSYFTHLNPMTSLLDPVHPHFPHAKGRRLTTASHQVLHTVEFCRSRSAFLYTAILTVATKVAHPAIYPACLKYARTLQGQAFEYGVNNLELVQAMATLVFWSDATDDTGARKLAYCIRGAFDLGLHRRATRPLPVDQLQARMVLVSGTGACVLGT